MVIQCLEQIRSERQYEYVVIEFDQETVEKSIQGYECENEEHNPVPCLCKPIKQHCQSNHKTDKEDNSKMHEDVCERVVDICDRAFGLFHPVTR